MNNETHTPETDALITDNEHYPPQDGRSELDTRGLGWLTEHARKLERQRDELAEALRGVIDLAAEAIAWREESTDPADQEENLLIAYRIGVEQAHAALAKLTS